MSCISKFYCMEFCGTVIYCNFMESLLPVLLPFLYFVTVMIFHLHNVLHSKCRCRGILSPTNYLGFLVSETLEGRSRLHLDMLLTLWRYKAGSKFPFKFTPAYRICGAANRFCFERRGIFMVTNPAED